MELKYKLAQSHNTKIIEGTCLARELEERDANFPDQNVQHYSVTSLETASSLDNGPSCSWGAVG